MVAAPSDARCTAEDGPPRRLLEGGWLVQVSTKRPSEDGVGAAGPARGSWDRSLRWAPPERAAGMARAVNSLSRFFSLCLFFTPFHSSLSQQKKKEGCC